VPGDEVEGEGLPGGVGVGQHGEKRRTMEVAHQRRGPQQSPEENCRLTSN
jgi:hypothetical protein